MAKLRDEDFNHAAYKERLVGLPEKDRATIEKKPGDRLYLHTPSGKRGIVENYHSSGTFFVHLCSKYNAGARCMDLLFVHPDHLVECDLPEKIEKKESVDGIAAQIVEAMQVKLQELGIDATVERVSLDEFKDAAAGIVNELDPTLTPTKH